MDDAAKKILAKRRDRTIATILGAKEDMLDEHLPYEVQREFRKVLLDQINDFYDLASDILKSVQPEGVIMNEDFLEKIVQIHQAVVGD